VGAGLLLPTELQLYTGVHVVLAAAALFISWAHCERFRIFDPDTYRWVLPTGLAILSLSGLPLLTGFPVRVGLYRAILTGNRWLLLIIMVLAEALTLGALLRVVLDVEDADRTEREEGSGARSPDKIVDSDGGYPELSVQDRLSALFQRINYGAALILACGIVVLGAVPRVLGLSGLGYWMALPSVPVWAALLLPVVGAGASYRSQGTILSYVEMWWPVLCRVLRPGKLLRPLERGLDSLGSLIWGATRVVEGAGYMAWVVLVCLVVLLFVLGGR
jgi:hypothetical protein